MHHPYGGVSSLSALARRAFYHLRRPEVLTLRGVRIPLGPRISPFVRLPHLVPETAGARRQGWFDLRRVAELDGLRGLAAIAVVACHLFPERFGLGGHGVDLFFVLSGFLITGIILRHGDAPAFLRAFYARRALRIWPIYFAAIATLVALGCGPAEGLGLFLAYAQNLSHYLGPRDAPEALFAPAWPYFAHSWTLAVEEQFYLIWPLAVSGVGPRRVQRLALGLLAVAVSMRALGFGWHLLGSRADGLALGAVLATRRMHGQADRAAAVGLLGAACFAVGAFLRESDASLPLPRAASVACVLGAACLSYAVVAWTSRCAAGRLTAPLRWRPLTYVGTISYGIYLYHLPLTAGLARRLASAVPGAASLPRWALVIPLTAAAAILSWHLLERPLLRLKDRISYRGEPAATERVGCVEPAL
jgi:peptidoglycan/LPS O-acetylase OafA/YrhL